MSGRAVLWRKRHKTFDGSAAIFGGCLPRYRDSLDPHLIYDPNSEYFLGKVDRIGQYRATMQDQVNFRTQPAPCGVCAIITGPRVIMAQTPQDILEGGAI